MIRQTFGRDQTLLVGFSTFTGTVTAAPKWGDPAHLYELNPGIPGSHEAILHEASQAMPGQADYGIFFRNPDGRDDPAEVELVACMSETRMDRAVGVKYNKEPEKEVEGHYRDVVMSLQYDCLFWVDLTTALRPIDMTEEWRAGELNPKTHQ
jgi:erythromycin esterase-like protein